MVLGESIPIFENIFHITYILNKGAAFGILHGYSNYLILIAFFLLIVIFILYKMIKKSTSLLKITLALLCSGALGNLIDRIRLGAVVDFLDFRIWPIFNFADITIVVSSVFLFYYILVRKSNVF